MMAFYPAAYFNELNTKPMTTAPDKQEFGMKELLQQFGQLVEKHGDKKAEKVMSCASGLCLALKCFDEDVALAALEFVNSVTNKAKP